MALSANSTLITSANKIDLIANGSLNNDQYFGTAGADAFVIADGDVGDDSIIGFSANDTIITGKKIFDGNGDGYIDFGPNAVLDVDRTSSKNAGNDQISVLGAGNDRTLTIRYLGNKDGGFAYGAAEVRDDFLGHFTKGSSNASGSTGGDAAIQTFAFKYDSQVTSETFDFGKGSSVLLIDNATGLNFGGDTINTFGNDDLLVTTSKLYDSDDNTTVTFGGNRVLDLSGSTGPQPTDPNGGPGGQVDVNNPNKLAVTFIGEKTIGDTTYYYYGSHYVGPDLGFGGGDA